PSGRKLFSIQTDGLIETAAFSPDGQILATASADAISLWEMPTARELYQLSGPGLPVLGLAFSPDGRTLATGLGNATALQWDLQPPPWKGKAVRNLEDEDFDSLWTDLSAEEGALAYQAAWMLVAVPSEKVCTFLKAHLPLALQPSPTYLRQL